MIRQTIPFANAKTNMFWHTSIYLLLITASEQHAFVISEKATHTLSCGWLWQVLVIFLFPHVGTLVEPKNNGIIFSANHLDQLWGILSRWIAHESGLLDPGDVMTAISSELSKPTMKDWIGHQTQVSVQKLDATRSWRSLLPGTGVKLEGGLLKDGTGNHLFLCMQRRGTRLAKSCFQSLAYVWFPVLSSWGPWPLRPSWSFGQHSEFWKLSWDSESSWCGVLDQEAHLWPNFVTTPYAGSLPPPSPGAGASPSWKDTLLQEFPNWFASQVLVC